MLCEIGSQRKKANHTYYLLPITYYLRKYFVHAYGLRLIR